MVKFITHKRCYVIFYRDKRLLMVKKYYIW